MADRTKRWRRLLGGALFIVLGALLFLDGASAWRWIAYGSPTMTNFGFQVRYKRATWLPGPAAMIPSQRCPACQHRNPEKCFARGGKYTFYQPSPFVLAPGMTGVSIPTVSAAAGQTRFFTSQYLYKVEDFSAHVRGERDPFIMLVDGLVETDGVEFRCQKFSFPELTFEVDDFECVPKKVKTDGGL